MTTTVLRPFIWDYPYQPVPDETFTHSHLSWSSTILCQHPPSTTIHSILPVQFTCLTVLLHNLSPSLLWSILVWNPTLHSLYISSPNHCILFKTHSHTITACFAVVPRLCHLILVSQSTLLGTVSFTLMSHIHLTILISAYWSATLLSFLTGQVSFPCNILLLTPLLNTLPIIDNDISLLVSNSTNCLNLFQPIQILASTVASASPSTLKMSPEYQNLSSNSRFPVAPISTFVWPVLVTGFKQPLQINNFITLDMLPLYWVPLHHSCIHFWQPVHCTELLLTPLPQTTHGHLAAFCISFWHSPLTITLVLLPHDALQCKARSCYRMLSVTLVDHNHIGWKSWKLIT